jgi:alpha-aminoadipic semialdehyde synthase
MRLTALARQAARQVVFGLRREDKSRWERRAPLAPKHVEALVQAGAKVLVQPSSTRVFTDEEYQNAKAEISEDLTLADHIFAVKEVPSQLLIPNKTYYFFSHTIKAQRQNMPMLDVILQKKINLVDYERIVNEKDVRLVKFGRFAGNAGMVDALAGVGDRLLQLGHSTPFLYMSYSKGYPSLDAAKKATADIGKLIAEHGIPKALHPFTFTFVGAGAVGQVCWFLWQSY